MATEIIMPKAGMAMESGTVIQWFKKPGDYVEAGEPLLEIETDKVAMEVEAETSGYLLSTLYGEGDEVPVITTIGYLGEKDEQSPAAEQAPAAEQPPAAADAAGGAKTDQTSSDQPDGSPERSATTRSLAPSEAGAVPATPAARRRAEEIGVDLATIEPSGQWGEVRLRDVESQGTESQGGTEADGSAPRVSSVAKKIAEENGVDLNEVAGSGPGGRIVKQDVLDAIARGGTTSSGTTGGTGPRAGGAATSGTEERIPLRGMRKVIAQRMSYSHQTVPPVTMHRTVSMDALLELRRGMNAGAGNGQERTGAERVSVTDLIVKAVARALVDAPYMRTAIDGDHLVVRDQIDIGIAVALEEGLLVPVIRGVAGKPLSTVMAERADLVARARNRSVTPEEVQGATFTVTNLGMYGITSFTPIVNTPESGILGVNAIEDRLYLDDAGVVRNRKEMTLSLTIDHRVVDGAQGAIFLDALAKLIENPVQILI